MDPVGNGEQLRGAIGPGRDTPGERSGADRPCTQRSEASNAEEVTPPQARIGT